MRRMVVTSNNTDFTYQTYLSASTTTIPNHSVEIDWNQLFSCGYFDTEDDYKSFVNQLHIEELRKDKFRNILIVPKEVIHYYQAPFRSDIRPPTRNLKGMQYARN